MATPTGLLSLTLATMTDMISHTVAWQSWIGTNTPETAAQHIYLLNPNADAVITYPFILMRWSTFDFHSNAGGFGQQYVPHHVVRLIIEDDMSDNERDETAGPAYGFFNHLGDLITDFLAQAGQGDKLIVRSISLDGGILPSEESILGFPRYCYRAQLLIEIGYS